MQTALQTRQTSCMFCENSVSKMASVKLLGDVTKKALFRCSPAGFKISVNSRALSAPSDWVPVDKETHTGQKWDKDDYRLARFIDRPKQINEQFAIKLINEAPPKECSDRIVWCDGGGGPTGHPKVYINLDKPGNHICGYCGLRFYKDDHRH